MIMERESESMTLEQAAARLGVSVNTLRKYMEEGFNGQTIRAKRVNVAGRSRVMVNAGDVELVAKARDSAGQVNWEN